MTSQLLGSKRPTKNKNCFVLSSIWLEVQWLEVWYVLSSIWLEVQWLEVWSVLNHKKKHNSLSMNFTNINFF